MNKNIYYYFFGPQCYGYKYMGLQAKKVAKILDYNYYEKDMTKENIPTYLNLYCPGNIVVDDLIITYPGSPEQLIESIKLDGPLIGEHKYLKELANGEPSTIKPIVNHLKCGASICLNNQNLNVDNKLKWLKKEAKYAGGEAGFIAFVDQEAVAAVEFVCEKRIPYTIPNKRDNFLFVTCIYNKLSADKDYRNALINKLKKHAINNGFKGISIICGYETPYPNGPVNKLLDNNFIIRKDLARVMLRYKWERICFMEWLIEK